jgi:hypothetical protein
MIKYLFLFVALFLTNHLNAQKNIGLIAGSVYSNRINRNVPDLVTNIIPTEYETISSFYAGVYTDFSISDHFLLSPELFFTRRGSRWNYDPLQISITIINNIIAMPVPIKFCFLTRYQVYFGPEFSYIISRDSKGVALSSSSVSKYEKSCDIALSAGGSINVTGNLYIDFRYNLGLIDQVKAYYIPGELVDPGLAGQQIPVNYEAYNRSFLIGLKYNFIRKD